MRTTVAVVCIFLFFVTTLLCLYQIGGTGGALRGGYLMMATYYSNNYGDRPLSFILADQDLRSDLGRAFLVQDTRSMRFFKSKVGDEGVQEYATGAWVVSGVSMKEFFGYMRGMEIGIIATGSVMIISVLLPFYFDGRGS